MAKITFIDPDGTRHQLSARPGQSLLQIARKNDIAIEGACEGCVSCATCHVVVDPGDYKRLPAVDEDEAEMLNLAFGLTATSRLGCRVRMHEELDGLTVTVPAKFAG
jgi:2Fe-2S ferredoxin